MEPPPGIAFAQDIEWVSKEPALVVWTDPGRSEISSLGLPCPTGTPTLLTLWLGKDTSRGLYILLHLRITIRVSKRRKTFDHFLLPSQDTCATESSSVVNLDNAPENIRQCLKEAYGNSSTKKCLRVPFRQPKRGRVLMPTAPENVPCLGGTALHLLTLLRSLSCAHSLDIFVGHSSYAQQALMNFEGDVSVGEASVDLPRSYSEKGGVFDDWRRVGEQSNGCSNPQKDLSPSREDPENSYEGAKNINCARTPEVPVNHVLEEEEIERLQPTYSPPPYSPPLQNTLPATPKDTRVPLKRPRGKSTPQCLLSRSDVAYYPDTESPPTKSARSHPISKPCSPTLNDTSDVVHDTILSLSLEQALYSPTVVNTPSTIEVLHTIHSEPHTPTVATKDEGDGASTGPLLSIQGDTSPSAISTSDRSETPGIKPTIFKKRHELPRYSPKAEDVASQTDQEHLSMKVVRSFTSAHESWDVISPRSVIRSLNKELRTLISAQVPLLTEQALQRVMEDLLDSLEYSQKVAENGLQETFDNLKVELQLETEKGVEELDEHAGDTLTDVKDQMEDLASGHLLAFEDMLQRTGEQLKQSLRAFLEVLAKAVAMNKHDDRTANNDTISTQCRDQQPAVSCGKHSPVAPDIAASPAAAATKLFLHEFGDLCMTAKVKVLDRLASHNTAEVFLTVDKELREAWIASWTGQTLP
ncbi:unnamed protein product [Aureobasidium vineae]|uniref:Uncharacterized protein n=1 Tax=Aureobasidium vineae TaxID=2773715 RepID=A0A9N8P9R3_9PEZI|nr:unnamed protein product [Aureobasidium vineae]